MVSRDGLYPLNLTYASRSLELICQACLSRGIAHIFSQCQHSYHYCCRWILTWPESCNMLTHRRPAPLPDLAALDLSRSERGNTVSCSLLEETDQLLFDLQWSGRQR